MTHSLPSPSSLQSSFSTILFKDWSISNIAKEREWGWGPPMFRPGSDPRARTSTLSKQHRRRGTTLNPQLHSQSLSQPNLTTTHVAGRGRGRVEHLGPRTLRLRTAPA